MPTFPNSPTNPSVACVFRQIHDAGLTLRVDGDRLIARPTAYLTAKLRELVTLHKAALLDFLDAARTTAAEVTTEAMRLCDRYGDGPAAREQMRHDCDATPPHLQADLLAYLREQRKGMQ